MDVTYALDLDAPAIGFRRLSSNSFLNLQANRWLVTERAVADFLPVVPRTTRIADWVRTYLDLADRVREQEHDLEAAFFARGAEFFMQPGNPLKAPTRRRFVSSLRRCFALEPELIPFEGGFLPAYELTDPDAAQPPRSTWVVLGGFDSYIEEAFPVLAAVAKRGRRVIAFEGPGQGGTLEAGTLPGLRTGQRLTMRTNWAAPVSAVLDHFDIEETTLVGMSLGASQARRRLRRARRLPGGPRLPGVSAGSGARCRAVSHTPRAAHHPDSHEGSQPGTDRAGPSQPDDLVGHVAGHARHGDALAR